MGLLAEMRDSQLRERRRILDEMTQVRGLMPVLMKPRNGQYWSPAEKTMLLMHLREIDGLSPYLVPVVLPGGVFMLPLLAWWLDRRRQLRG